jgi:peptidoglycan hydrolase-like amidase
MLVPRIAIPRRSFLKACLGTALALPGAGALAQSEFRSRNFRVRICVLEKTRRVVAMGRQDYNVLSDGNAVLARLQAGEPYFIDNTHAQPGATTYRLVLRELDGHQVDEAIALAKQAKQSYKLPVKVFRIPSREPDGGSILVTLGEFATMADARAEVARLRSEQVSLIYEDRAVAVSGLARLFDRTGRVLARDPRRLRLSPTDPHDGDLAIHRTDADDWSEGAIAEARRYRGDMDLTINEEGSLTAVNDLWVEQYLYSVVGAEIGDDSPMEALKAQAVAGRSEAVAKIEGHIVSNSFFDFYDTAIAQCYLGLKSESDATRQAVDATRGELLVWDGQAVDAVYGHCCGGMIASSVDVWGGSHKGFSERRLDRLVPGQAPDLSSWRDVYDFVANDEPSLCNPRQQGYPDYAKKYYRWEKSFTGKEFSRMCDESYNTGRVKDIYVVKRTPSGRVAKLSIVGVDRTATIGRELEIRRALGDIYSDMFALVKQVGPDGLLESLQVLGGGFGHGVGMCQMGALAMARMGYNYRQILAHYYNDVKIRRLYR